MLLYRTPQGALSYDPPSYVVFGRQRVTVEEFRAGKLDDALLDAFGLAPLVVSLARLEVETAGIPIESLADEHAGRPQVERTWSFARGVPCAVRILGRHVSARAGDVDYQATFEVHLANGFPAALAERLGADVVDAVNASVTALAPLPCMCHTGAVEMSQHGTLMSIASKQDPRAPVECEAAVARCTVCGQGWLFEWYGDSHYSFTYSASELTKKHGVSEEEMVAILADLRAGNPVTVAKSRGATTYLALTDGNFRIDEDEDGSGEERTISEATMRWYVQHSPEIFVEALRKPLRAALRDALYAATTPETRAVARDRLDQLLIYGPSVHHVDLVSAFLAWPERAPDADTFAGKSGNDLYHAVMSAIGYDQTNEAGGKFGLRFIEAVVAMMGNDDLPDLRTTRADFRKLAGDEKAATGYEQQMRTQTFGPPMPYEKIIWSFLEPLPEAELRNDIWPIVSRLLESSDVNVRGCALEFMAWWSDGKDLTLPRLLEVAETRPELFDDEKHQYVTIRSELASALCSFTGTDADEARLAAIAKRLCEKEVLYSVDYRMGRSYPDWVIERTKVWADHPLWFHNAGSGIARHHPDKVIPFLEAVRGFPREEREGILSRVREACTIDPNELKRAIDL